MAVALRVLPLADPVSFRLSEVALARLKRAQQVLGANSQTGVLEAAITHYLGTLLRDEPTWQTLPGQPQVAIPEGEQ